MRTETLDQHRRIILYPGEYYASKDPVTISTLLGSCVAACLYDSVNHVIGMNHFMLSQKSQRGLPTLHTEAGRYGVNAMELLMNEMFKCGAQRRHLKAKVFGGSTVIDGLGEAGRALNVGTLNCKFIREFLACEKIPLLAEDLGGKHGRVIHFSHGNFVVYARKIKSEGTDRRLAMRDHNCWLHAIEEQKKLHAAKNSIQLWD